MTEKCGQERETSLKRHRLFISTISLSLSWISSLTALTGTSAVRITSHTVPIKIEILERSISVERIDERCLRTALKAHCEMIILSIFFFGYIRFNWKLLISSQELNSITHCSMVTLLEKELATCSGTTNRCSRLG